MDRWRRSRTRPRRSVNDGMKKEKRKLTYEVVLEIGMHVIDSIVHDGCRDVLASESECPCLE